MMDNQYSTQFFPIHMVGYQQYEVPGDVLESLDKETSKMISKKFKDLESHGTNLSGRKTHQYRITKSAELLELYVSTVAPLYWNNFFYDATSFENKNKKHSLVKDEFNDSKVWVNFEKKHAFQPIHRGAGLLSFVIFLKIPYLFEDERKKDGLMESEVPLSGTFNFLHVNETSYIRGPISTQTLPIDKSSEGTMVVFPSNLQHVFYPFHSSDDYRIVISGNIVLDGS
jgi:hypothetical protein